MAHPESRPQREYGFGADAFDASLLPDGEREFGVEGDFDAFLQALSAPDPTQSPEDAMLQRVRSPTPSSPALPPPSSTANGDNATGSRRRSLATISEIAGEGPRKVAAAAAAASADVTLPAAAPPQQQQQQQQQQQLTFITAQNDWAPVRPKLVRSNSGGSNYHRVHHRRSVSSGRGSVKSSSRRKRRRAATAATAYPGRRTRDEIREGYLYGLLQWPFLLIVGAWIAGLGVTYLATRVYISLYETVVTWRGRRQVLRRNMRATSSYPAWKAAARELDSFLGNDRWKEDSRFAYYDSHTVRRVWEQMRRCREMAEAAEATDRSPAGSGSGQTAVEDLKILVEACVKNNFVGVENPRLYSQTYYGTKNLVQYFMDELEKSVQFLLTTTQLPLEEKRPMFKRIQANFGRTALCLSGGATFAYYHFGVVRALLDEDLLPDVISGTSGGALVAALAATRTNDELRALLVPALARRLSACDESVLTWAARFWRTGARFDSATFARKCSWFTRGSTTFREAFERTGRILNVSCVPADPHSPTILCNYLTSPDCVIWSAVLASAAVPGILNPVVLMMKTRDGELAPYSFGHKWKDGSLRTDIPIKALNLHFNVNFTIVSQVNPHINLFFFSSRGTVGQPVTHRKGRGWRGGYLGSATEQYLKLDLTKWLKVLRHLELLPRPLGQDWSLLWLQQFSGTVTIWPKSVAADFWHILSDPDPPRLARMLHEGQQSAFPKLKFVANRLRVERAVEQGRRESRPFARRGSIETILSEDELRSLMRRPAGAAGASSATVSDDDDDDDETTDVEEAVIFDDNEDEEDESSAAASAATTAGPQGKSTALGVKED